MTSRKRHSSRKRMESRSKRRLKPSPIVIQSLDGKTEFDANRAAKKQRAYFQTHSAGLSVRQEQQQKRKDNQTATRRALRKMRKETKAAQRAAAGGV